MRLREDFEDYTFERLFSIGVQRAEWKAKNRRMNINLRGYYETYMKFSKNGHGVVGTGKITDTPRKDQTTYKKIMIFEVEHDEDDSKVRVSYKENMEERQFKMTLKQKTKIDPQILDAFLGEDNW